MLDQALYPGSPGGGLPTTSGSEYAYLCRQIRQACLLDRRRRYYLIRIAVTGVLFAAAWIAFALIGESWWQLFLAAALAVIFTQIGFLGHNAGHRQVFRSHRANDLDYLRRQVLTSRNVSGGWFIDTAMGGLNYQIEDDLFPSMPRPNLRHTQKLIREFCRQHDVSYCETTLIRSWRQALSHLNDVGGGTAQAMVG